MMRRIVVAGLFALAWTSPAIVAAATAQRTFVASNGNDTLARSIPQPCRTIAAALAKTSASDEVMVLDSVGYGPVNVTQSVAIIAPPGVYAGIAVFSGDGIVVNGNGIAVVLRDLSINGQGGSSAIYFVQGASLTIEDCAVANMSGDGITSLATNSQVTIRNVVVRGNGAVGIAVKVNGGDTRVTIGNSLVSENGSVGISAVADAGAIQVAVARSIVSRNDVGFFVGGINGGWASILSDGNTVTYSSFALQLGSSAATAAIYSPGNNTVGYYGLLVSGGVTTLCCGV